MKDNNWARMLAYVTGLVNQELLLQNEYLAAENRILRAHLPAGLRLSDPERSTLAENCRHAKIPIARCHPTFKPIVICQSGHLRGCEITSVGSRTGAVFRRSAYPLLPVSVGSASLSGP